MWFCSLTAKIVSCHVTDRQRVVRGDVRRSEAWAANAGMNGSSRADQPSDNPLFVRLRKDCLACRINSQGDPLGRIDIVVKKMCRNGDIFKRAADAACNACLLHSQTPMINFILKGKGKPVTPLCRVLFNRRQHIAQVRFIFVKAPYRKNIGGVKRKGDHRFQTA